MVNQEVVYIFQFFQNNSGDAHAACMCLKTAVSQHIQHEQKDQNSPRVSLKLYASLYGWTLAVHPTDLAASLVHPFTGATRPFPPLPAFFVETDDLAWDCSPHGAMASISDRSVDPAWQELDGIGDRVLFVDSLHEFAVPTAGFGNLERNVHHLLGEQQGDEQQALHHGELQRVAAFSLEKSRSSKKLACRLNGQEMAMHGETPSWIIPSFVEAETACMEIIVCVVAAERVEYT
ncbi:uncharacterized protein C2845_PM13G17960 [Panicum miliaceum]|uniref:Uncharacterized protein n=1 Tax=Panicum miliaceum TaxID=4540 RepID=A0A3L6RGP7_PANMI|nr:uncharacterized protein C2845_PM13G17960 [Panicum miliaceum]